MRYEKFSVNELTVKKIINAGNSNSSAGLTLEIHDGLSPLSLAVDPSLGITAGDDFPCLCTTGFPYKIQGTNGTCLSVVNTPYGVIRLLATGADNDECYVTYNNALGGLIKADATHDWCFEARVKLSQATAEQGVFVGLAQENGGVGADFITDNTMALKVVDAIGFQIVHASAASAMWQTIIQKSSGARVAVNDSAKAGSTDYIKLGMRSKSGVVSFYANGNKLAGTVTTTATNFPLDKVMLPTFGTKTGKAAANSLDVDWWRASQLR